MSVVIEFSDVYGMQETALTPEELIDKSGKAFDSAMNTIHEVAERVTTTIKSIDISPDNVEISFAIKLTAEAGAVIAKTGVEGSFGVKLTWKKD